MAKHRGRQHRHTTEHRRRFRATVREWVVAVAVSLFWVAILVGVLLMLQWWPW